MGTGMNTEGFLEEVTFERALKDDGRRGPMATWRSSLRRGLGLEGTWGSRTRPDPGAGDIAEEPLQRSRLKAIREKPCRKTQYHPCGSQRGIYYRSSSPNVEAEMEAQDAVSRLFRLENTCSCSVWGRAAFRTAPARQRFLPLPSSPAAPTAGGGGSVPPACRLCPHDLL